MQIPTTNPMQCPEKILRKGGKWNWTHCKTSYYRLHAWIEMKLTEIGDLPVACCWTADSPPNPEDKEGLHWCFLQICRLRSELKTLSVGTLPWPANNYYEMQLENKYVAHGLEMHDLYACLPFKPGFATCILLQRVHMWPCSQPLRMRSTYACRVIDSFLFYLMQALSTRIAWQNIVTNPMQSQYIIASHKVTTPCCCCDEAGHCTLMKAGPCSTWPQLDIHLAVAPASLLRIEPLPTPKSNLSCYRLNCIRREQKIYLPSYAYMLNSRVALCVTTSKGSELHERW
jgi:hypothetical protein